MCLHKREEVEHFSAHQSSEIPRTGVFRAYDGNVVARQHVHLPRGRAAARLLAGVASPQRLKPKESYVVVMLC